VANAETLQPVCPEGKEQDHFHTEEFEHYHVQLQEYSHPQIFLESIMQCKKILIGLLEYLFPFFGFVDHMLNKIVNRASYAQL